MDSNSYFVILELFLLLETEKEEDIKEYKWPLFFVFSEGNPMDYSSWVILGNLTLYQDGFKSLGSSVYLKKINLY